MSAIVLLSNGSRSIAFQRSTQWGPSWLSEPPVEPPKPAESPAIPEPVEIEAPVAPAVLPIVEGEACSRCGSIELIDTPIHDGRSIRRDCATCHRTVGFPVWNPSP